MIELPSKHLDDLFASACDRIRSSVRQSQDSILRNSRRRLAENALDADATYVLAASSLTRRKPGESLRILSACPTVVDEDATGNRLAGYAWLLKDQTEQARHCFDRAVRIDPHLTDCWKLLGKIAEHEERHDDAVRFYRRALVFANADHESAIALSKIQARQHRLRDAIHTLRICLLRDQRCPKLNVALARLLERRAIGLSKRCFHKRALRLRIEALECYQRANAAAPACNTLVAQGELQQRLQKTEHAKRSFEAALALDPDSSIALSSLAAANVDLGNLDDAARQFEASFTCEPARAVNHFRYTRTKKFKTGTGASRYVTQLRELLAARNLPRRQELHLHFALGKVLDDIGDHNTAWEHFDLGNRLNPGHSENQSAKPSSIQDLAIESERFFSRQWFDQRRHLGNQDATPILIVGMPRSGTTLTEQILSSHSMVAGAGELTDWNQIRHEVTREGDASNNEAAGALTRGLATIGEGELARLASEYVDRLDAFRTDERHVTDKMPTNFLLLGLVATLFPKATLIHCRRNPLDVLSSCYCQNLSAPFCDLDQLVSYHRNYRRMMRHWETVLPMKIHTVDYEAMVASPETQTRELLTHCGLEWEDQCLRFHANTRAVQTPSKWQVRQPMYRSSVEKWRRFERHLAPIAAQIANELEAENWHSDQVSA